MKKLIAILLAMLMICSLFVGCAKEPAEEPVTEPETPAVEGEEAPEEELSAMEKYGFDTLDVALFDGGYAGMWEEVVELFKSYYPGVEVTADISPDVDGRIRSRMMTNTPPDVILSGGFEFSMGNAAKEGLMYDLTDFLENGVDADGVPMSEVLSSDVLAYSKVNGKVYNAPYSMTYLAWWYNVNMFNELNLEAPKTMEEFRAVCQVLKDNDIIPFMYQDHGYAVWGLIYQIIAAFGGRDLYNDCFVTLTPGAWVSEDAVAAITEIEDWVKAGYLSRNSAGADFAATQVDYVNSRIGIIPNGTWFENEMKDSTPEGFDMAFLAIPAGPAGDTRYVCNTNIGIGMPAHCTNPEAGKAFLGVLFSAEGQKTIAKYGSMPAASTVNLEEVKEYMSPINFTALEECNREDVEYVFNAAEAWYGPLNNAMRFCNDELVLGDMTAQDYCEYIENICEELRNDPDVVIHTID